MSVTPRVEKIRQNYVNTKPSISYERARIWTESFKRTEGQPAAIRTAQAFYDTCNELCVNIFEGELIVGASGEFRKCGILTPEFAWKWVDDEMDNFPSRPQDPYEMTDGKTYSRIGKANPSKMRFLRVLPKKQKKLVWIRAFWIRIPNGVMVLAKFLPIILTSCSRRVLAA